VDSDLSNQLTERQRQLLELVASGITASKALASDTGIAPGTVDNNLVAAAKVLGVVGRIAAAERYVQLRQNSHDPSHVRLSRVPTGPDFVPSGGAGTARQALGAIGAFLRGPPLGGEEHSLRWDQITLQILRVAVIGMVTVVGLVLLILGFFKTFG
jgi:DNA-binding CsgD family transcriptional regulator